MKRIITGLLIIVGGVVLLLANIDVLQMDTVVRDWWPIGLIVVGALIVWNDPRNYVWAILIGGLGAIYLFNNLTDRHINVGKIFFPALVIAIGVAFLTNRQTPPVPSDQSNENITALLSGSTAHNSSKDYTGATLTAVMGGVDLDIRQAQIAEQASIEVRVLMGGVTILVADNVIVKNCTTAILGGVEDKTKPQESQGAPVLYLHGPVVMGGVEIKR